MAGDISPRAPYGSLLKPDRPKKPKKVARVLGRNPRERNSAHLDAVRQCPCLTCGADHGCEAAHVRMSVQGRPNPGLAQKANDHETVPLCSACHREQHAGSEAAFWDRHMTDPLKVAAALAKFADLEPMRAVIFAVRAKRALGRDAR